MQSNRIQEVYFSDLSLYQIIRFTDYYITVSDRTPSELYSDFYRSISDEMRTFIKTVASSDAITISQSARDGLSAMRYLSNGRTEIDQFSHACYYEDSWNGVGLKIQKSERPISDWFESSVTITLGQ